ncbi:hypothetical protein K7J14_14425 [Treponema zuelzerae]|uniref:Uncharacterized protein n=1 Tax=Teretinema zuelzerae TaxID=156 RepID=A0AAE3EKF5_9SPIR|nr:hypothetical protein [Teretinema zuelzerae]MCD1655891.1 hypothetical protein [Teretinema zuelzerae]
MKMAKSLAIAMLAVSAAAGLAAQTASIHGYLDYTNFAVGQEFQKAGDGDYIESDAAAEFGSFYNGRTSLDVAVDAQNFHFETGVCLDASLGTWYGLYNDVDTSASNADDIDTIFYKGNVRVELLNGQARIMTGKFEDATFGYTLAGYALGNMPTGYYAQRDFGQHFTAVEFTPYKVDGLGVMVGLPILPVSGNGVNYAAHNAYPDLLKKFKAGVRYAAPFGVKFVAGYYNEVHLEGTANYSEESLYTEAWLQADMPNLVPGVALNAGYDFRLREDNDAMHHSFTVSGKFSPVNRMTVALEDRLVYNGEHYFMVNEIQLFNQLAAAVSYDLGKSFVAGFNTQFMYAQDANGSTVSNGRLANVYDDNAMVAEWMPFAANVATGTPGTYIGVYGYPYIQKNFQNGYLRTGVEVQYTGFETSTTSSAIGYRVPVAMCFWF